MLWWPHTIILYYGRIPLWHDIIKVRMPRRRIDLHSELRGAAPSEYTHPVHLQQLPCRCVSAASITILLTSNTHAHYSNTSLTHVLLQLDSLFGPTLALTPTPALTLTLTLLPCSWGSLFFPAPWREFHRYMRRRLHGKAVAVQIPHRYIYIYSARVVLVLSKRGE